MTLNPDLKEYHSLRDQFASLFTNFTRILRVYFLFIQEHI
jgi:hypothetical protein